MPVKLVEVFRGNTVESTHRGDIAVVNSEGKVLYELGNIDRLTYYRSSSKPFIALAALEWGIAEKFGLDLKEIALITASHSGEKEHIEVLEKFMKKVGVSNEAMVCGASEPVNKDAAKELVRNGIMPSKLHCNCSGKHIGLIAACKTRGISHEGYHENSHGMQREIDRVISDFSNFKAEDIKKGVDGCGLPIHAVPLRNIALSYANLCDRRFMEGRYAKSQNYVLSSMTMYPEMVAGKGRLDTEIMRNFGDRLIAKIGSEGIYCIGLLEKSTGIAVKIEDGSSRAVGPAVLNILLRLKVINKEELEKLKEFWKPDIRNSIGEKVGEIRAVF